MRFRLIFLILLYSQIFAQSTVFVKYKTEISIKKGIEKISSYSQNLSSNLKDTPLRFRTFTQIFGKLNNHLNKIVKIDIPKSADKSKFLNSLQNNPDIEYIHLGTNLMVDYIPADSLFSEQWALESINATAAWNILEENPKDVVLAVIDTGIDYLHPDIDATIHKNLGEVGIDDFGNEKSTNGVDDDGNGFIDDFQGWDFVDKIDIFPAEINDDFTDWDNNPMDDNGHGTNIAGIIGAEHNAIGIAGASRNIKVMNLRAFDKNGSGEEDDAASAIIYAVKMGAKIINMSWGDSQFSELLKDVIQYAYENGVILVASAGNTSSDLPHYPSSFSEVISVGAIQENNALAGFSNYGSTIDLVAPGSQIYTLGLDGTYKKVSGTSASAPFVSATAAAISSQRDFTNEEIRQIIKSTAQDIGDPGWDLSFGAGNLNFEKAIRLLSPSIILFNHPVQDFYTSNDNININISCLSPYFKNFELSFGIGYDPENWERIETDRESFQLFEENVYDMDVSEFADTVYTLRLLLNRIDGVTQEERVNFYVDRSPPEILTFNLFPAFLNDIETVHGSIITDDKTTARLYFRERNGSEEFNSISLDGFVQEIGMVSTSHYGILPIHEVISGVDHEFYFEVTNQSGLSSTQKDGERYFYLRNIHSSSIISSIIKDYSLPNGRIFKRPVKFNDGLQDYILINENNSSSDLSIFEFSSDREFELTNVLKNKIPVGSDDFNKDGKIDLLNLYVKNGYIDSEILSDPLSFENSFTDSTESFWPSHVDDIDSDGNFEIIVFSSDTSITIWEVNTDLTLSKEKDLMIPIQENTIYRNNSILVDNFDNDPEIEILSVDNFGRIITFQINGNNTYEFENVIEHFFPVESNTIFEKGDFNGDGSMDIALLMEFEENVYQTPLTYVSVINISQAEISYLFQNMIVSAENSFTNRFEKQYHSLAFEDVNANNSEDLIIFSYPNSYIFEYNNGSNIMLHYQTNVNSQSIFIGDLDKNGVNEISIPNADKLNFHEFIDDGKIPAPTILDYYSIDATTNYFKWKDNGYPVYIFRGNRTDNMLKYDSSFANEYIDYVEEDSKYYYSLAYYEERSQISRISKEIELYGHAPGELVNIKPLSMRKIEVEYSLSVNFKDIYNLSITVDDTLSQKSFSPVSDKSLLLNFDNNLSSGDHKLTVEGLRDVYNTPFTDTSVFFAIEDEPEEKEFLFVTNYSILDNYNLVVRFNTKLDSITAINKNNYRFIPNNLIDGLNIENQSKNSVRIRTRNPFGAIGKEYVLKMSDIFSSAETGYLPMSENSGSEIVLTDNAENLKDIFVYPNPIRLSNFQEITFANLTNRVDIYIFSIDGIFINKISESDGNGGVSWNLTDEHSKKISSGIYFYKAISLDNFDNTLEEKIGKFAVLN